MVWASKIGVWNISQFEAGAFKEIIREIGRIWIGEPLPSLGAGVEIVVVMSKSRILSILVIDMNPNISGLQPNL